MTILEKVKNTIVKYKMLRKGDRVLVCVSGGADSVALLHVLNRLRGGLGISLHIAHLDHMMRPRESHKDMLFVKKIAKRFDIPVTASRINVPQIVQKKGSSLEDTARDERYKFFLKVALKINANKIATAHTMDDQAETVLMRLLRGSGVTGLRGIPPKRSMDNCLVLRPLIRIWKRDLVDYLKENNLNFRLDSSNLDINILRNRIRLKLLPLIKKGYNPNISEVLVNISENLNDIFEYMEEESRKAFLDSRMKANDDEVAISLSKLLKRDIAIQKEIVRMAIRELKGDLNRITYNHWQDIDSMIKEKSTGASLDLPDGIRCIKEYERLVFCRRKKKSPGLRKTFSVSLPGTTDIHEMGLEVVTRILGTRKELPKELKRKKNSIYEDTEEFFDFDKIILPLALRYKRQGDRLVPLGMKGTKKLKDLFIDEKIARDVRERIPVVITGRGAHERIIWVPPLRIADAVKVTDDTKRVVGISIRGFNG